jgi:exonuclease SbcC
LKEQCRQFDPAKIQSDIAAVEKEIERLTAEHERAAEKHRASRTHVEKLARQETAVAQRRKTIEHNIAAMVARHNQLFPAVARDQFSALMSCLDGAQASVTLPVLVPIDASAWSADSSEAAPVETARGWIEAETAFRDQAARVFEQVSTVLADKFRAFEAQRDDRLRAERDLANQQRNLDKLELESAQLKEQLRQTTAQAEEGQRESAKAEKALADLEASLKPFAELNQQITAQQLLKDEHAERYGRYLGAKPTADKLAERHSAFEQANAAETRAKEDLTRRTQAFEAVRSFDPAKLIAARRRAGDAEIKLAGESLHLQNAERELAREQARLGEWELALAAKQELLAAHARVEACLALTQMGRRILQKAAPLVAQHVCGRVAAKAQQIFNQLSDEPVELEWSAERYGLRISPGDRRFAMLSGGEQTKLAVAMTLAMLQEFSDLKFCIFDEPTYGVDAESRQKLADAILKVPGVSDNILDQLLVVSHDDAFEGKAGNVIVIRKTAAEGSLAGAPG